MSAYVPVGLILFMLAPTGCESPSGPKGVTVTDSAGVRIIELGPDLEGVAERRVLADEPDWVIRSREDDPSFVVSKVMDVELLSQGRIAIADEVGNEILVFDSVGRHVATWGGMGDGPVSSGGSRGWRPCRPIPLEQETSACSGSPFSMRTADSSETSKPQAGWSDLLVRYQRGPLGFLRMDPWSRRSSSQPPRSRVRSARESRLR